MPRMSLRLRAERHAHADFLRALRHGERQQAVDADAGEQERDRPRTRRARAAAPAATRSRDRRSRSSVRTSEIGSFGSALRMIARIDGASASRRSVDADRQVLRDVDR